MGTTLLRQFLQNLCCNSCWNYAVFWKLQHQGQMFLTWEDGYCDIPKQGHSMENIFNNISVGGLPEMSSSNYESSTLDGTFGGDTIGAAVAYMSNVQYPLGDGVVGEVASTGNYCWVFSGDLLSGEFNSKLVPECPDEWLFQFAAGIKTILLVPVVPHGVLQLGSLETVVEDLGVVSLIKEKFFSYQHFMGDSESSAVNSEFIAPSSSLLMSGLVENMDDLSALAMLSKPEDSMTIANVRPTVHNIFTDNQITSLCKAHDSTLASRTDHKISNPTEDDINTQLSIIEEPEQLSQVLNFSKLGMMESTLYGCLEEDLRAFSHLNNSNTAIFGEYAKETMSSDRLLNEVFTNDNAESTDHINVGSFLSFPRDCELHQALGTAFMGSGNDHAWDSSISAEDVNFPSVLICNGDVISSSEGRESNGGLVSSDDPEHLLGPVVSESYLDGNSSGITAGVNSCLTSSGIPNASLKRHDQTERSVMSEDNTLSWSRVTSAFVSRDRNPTVSSSPATTSYGSMVSELIEEEQTKKIGYPNQRKISKVSGASKRKGNPGDNKKPRPRDRQLIQDRLKELRELVPNGAKCSIDGLLDRTVAHMLFLKSVNERADKLRHWDHQEGVGRKKMKLPKQKGSGKFGTSWAFELGTEQQVCPIIVEDLEYPGHMLIEMICDENDRFLEIAEVIHGLNLTILKGMMEKRADNTWAHFLIEAPRGLHRLDIFWPLMKLLQHNPSPISS